MKKDTEGLTRRQRLTLQYFIDSSSISEACRLAGISTKTYYEWVNKTPFGKALQREKELLRAEAFTILKNSLPHAAKTLADLLHVANESVRRLAAKDIIDLVHTFIDLEKIEERIKTLEEKKNERVLKTTR